MNLNALTLPELEAVQGQLLDRLCRVRAAIQRKQGTESISQKITRLPKKQRAFVSALWEARGRTVELMDIEEKVWKGKPVNPETVRRLAYDAERRMEKEGIPLFIERIKRKNGDVMGYGIRKK